jgi:hypothetical protein
MTLTLLISARLDFGTKVFQQQSYGDVGSGRGTRSAEGRAQFYVHTFYRLMPA